MANYITVAFTDPGAFEWEVPEGVSEVAALAVAGGGGGGSRQGGGGGAGGLIHQSALVVSGIVSGSVGGGGAGGTDGGRGQNGSDSAFGDIIALGGGGGGGRSGPVQGSDGGSGGGGASSETGGQGVAGQGYSGGLSGADNSAGGGGGASESGGDSETTLNENAVAGTGGSGTEFVQFSAYGDSGWFAGGGGGATFSTGSSPGSGGSGGGGEGKSQGSADTNGAPGQDNTGGGGGGASGTSDVGGSGGSGIVLIRYEEPVSLAADPAWDDATDSYTLNVEWGEIQGATGYRLALLDDTGATLDEIDTTGLSHSFAGLAVETHYTLVLTPYDSAGDLDQNSLDFTTPSAPQAGATLAQPTGLRVQSLEPFATLEQSVSRENLAQQVVTLEQSTGGVRPARTVATLEQLSGALRINDTATAITLRQTAGALRINPAATAATLEQDVFFERVNDPLAIVTLSQRVDRATAARTIGRLRQTVQSVAAPWPAPTALARHTLVFLDDADISHQCAPTLDIAASEGDNRTATVTLYPGSGPINITSYQGRALEIHHRIDGAWQPVFVGTVDVPTYRRDSRTLQLRCSDLRGERLGREDQARLKTLTDGLYSDVTQREDAEGEQWVRELMKTVEGSLDYSGAGALRYRPWAVATPRFTLEAGDIHHREVSLEFATRSEIINRVPISVAFRWYKRNTFNAQIGAGVGRSNACKQGTCLPAADQTLPTKVAALGAAYNIAGWRVLTATAGSPPESGWYRYGVFNDKVLYGTTDAFRDTYATAINATLIRYVSQGMRSTSSISIEAPQSIDQFGAIDGSPLSFSIDTRVDPSVFEDTGCYSRPEQDRLADRTRAIEIAERMAAKQIRGSHRQNYASFRYKPKTDRAGAQQLLPVEIGDTISITTGEITATGWVTEFQHSLTRDGDRYTDIKLTISRVDSDVSVTENVEVPGVATPTRINREAQQAEPRLCVTDDEEGDDEPRRSDIAKDGTITLVAPSIAPDKTDELVGESSHSYQIAIPVNTFTVEVP